MEKKILPADIYDKVLIYMALETSKQAMVMVPESLKAAITKVEGEIISAYANEVNDKLNEMYNDIMHSTQDETIKTYVKELIDRDALGIQRIYSFKKTFTKPSED